MTNQSMYTLLLCPWIAHTDIYTAAVLAEQHTDRPLPSKEWKDMMDKLSSISCDAYRKIVRGDERFVPYFRAATPELELSNLNIGSRPAKRKATGGVESLRASESMS